MVPGALVYSTLKNRLHAEAQRKSKTSLNRSLDIFILVLLRVFASPRETVFLVYPSQGKIAGFSVSHGNTFTTPERWGVADVETLATMAASSLVPHQFCTALTVFWPLYTRL